MMRSPPTTSDLSASASTLPAASVAPVAGAQAGRAHQRVHHDVGLPGRRHEVHHASAPNPSDPFRRLRCDRATASQRRRRSPAAACARADLPSSDGVSQLVGNRLLSQALVAHREVAHAELRASVCASSSPVRVPTAEYHHLQLVRMATHNVQRSGADGARGA